MTYLTPAQLAQLDSNTKVEVIFSDFNRPINLIDEVRTLIGCSLSEAVSIVRDRNLTLVVQGWIGVMKVLAMVNDLNVTFSNEVNDGYRPEAAVLAVRFRLHETKTFFFA